MLCIGGFLGVHFSKAWGHRLPLMAVSASNRLRISSIAKLAQVFVVDVTRHGNHETRRRFHRISIGSKVHLFRLFILLMAVSTGNAKIGCEAEH
jgi:hypothetical protein